MIRFDKYNSLEILQKTNGRMKENNLNLNVKKYITETVYIGTLFPALSLNR